MPRTLLILSWDRPLLPQLVSQLTGACTTAPWDMRAMMIVVPTQESGRRLREALALAAAKRGTGVLAPTIVTPDQLVHDALPLGTASPRDCEAAWCSILLNVDLSRFPAVYPQAAARRDAAWVTSVAAQVGSLQQELWEHGLNFAEVSKKVQGTEFEPERWAQLAQLEGEWQTALQEGGLRDPGSAKVDRVTNASPPTGISKVVIGSVPDPAPLAVTMLSRWSECIPVEVICHGPTDTVVFEDWGRPIASSIDHRAIPFGKRSAIHPARDAKAAAEFAASIAKSYEPDFRTLALGSVDPTSTGTLKLALSARSITAYDPAGASLASGGVGLFATSLLRLAVNPQPSAAAQILRHPLMGHFAVAAKEWTKDQGTLLNAFDTLLNTHLPSDLETAASFARSRSHPEGLRLTLEWLVSKRRELMRSGVSATLLRILTEVLTAYPAIDLDGAVDASKKLGEILNEMKVVEERFPTIPPDTITLLLIQVILRTRIFPGQHSDAVDLQGWLELGYEDAPHLVLIGFNEGRVPETIRGDVFLPNSLRERLGMRGNRERFCRDQLLLEAHLRSRNEAGRVDIVVPRMGDDGDPIQPSRLLFRCNDDDLIARARMLFAELAPPPATPARRAAWKLSPLPVKLPQTHSPSSIKAYLSCPYRYYLTHILRAEQVDVGLQEISAGIFGDLCHDALQKLGDTAAMRDIDDPTAIGDFLVSEFEARAKLELGDADSFALRVQLEAGKARLRAAATAEAEERRQGWRIVRCESEWSMVVSGFTFKGRIDRVDRNEQSGMYRLIDYKTSDSGKPPDEAHWVRARDGEQHVLAASIFERDGRSWRWLDLQLPLYILATRSEHGGNAGTGYFVLPKTKEGTGIKLWTELTLEHLLHAEKCAVAVAEAIAERRFWPPASKLKFENPSDYMFPDGIEANVDAESMKLLAASGGAS